MENWKEIPGYEGRYSVSDMGNVKSENYHREGYAKALKPSVDADGYRRVLLYDGQSRKSFGVHQLVVLTFIPPDPSRAFVNHKDGCPGSDALLNLERCTAKENAEHAALMGLLPKQLKGSSHRSSAWFEVTDPAGFSQVIKGLNTFCGQHGLLQGEMSNVVTGRAKTHRGWRCRRLTEDEINANATASAG